MRSPRVGRCDDELSDGPYRATSWLKVAAPLADRCALRFGRSLALDGTLRFGRYSQQRQ